MGSMDQRECVGKLGKARYNEAAREARSSQGASSTSLIFHTAWLPDDFNLRDGQHIYQEAGGGRGREPIGKRESPAENDIGGPKPWLMILEEDTPTFPTLPGFPEGSESFSRMPPRACWYQEGVCSLAYHFCLGVRILCG